MIKLKPFQGKFGLIAPASAINPTRYTDSLKKIEQLNIPTKKLSDHSEFFNTYTHGFGSNSIEVRSNEIYSLLEDPEVGALLSVRGGKGSYHLLPSIDLQRIAAARKPMIGYSDISALLLAVYAKTGLVTIHGPMVAQEFHQSDSNQFAKESVETLLKLLTDPSYRFQLPAEILQQGTAKGPLLASNLTLFNFIIGTPWDVDPAGHILILEEIGEAPYQVERLLWKLYLSGKFENLAGLAFGKFTDCDEKDGQTVKEVIVHFIENYLKDKKYPISYGLPVGHPENPLKSHNISIPNGCLAEINDGSLNLLESPIED
jgi:muramoyltetrapeptide carboxypeptidase